MIYCLILFLIITLMIRYDIRGYRHNRELCYHIVLIAVILFAGLRYRIGGDTIHYLDRFYHLYPSLEQYDWRDFKIGQDPLYVLLNAWIKSWGGRFYIVQLIHASFVNILIFKYIKKHTPYIFTSIFFYFIMFYFLYNTEIMRASMSIVVALFANDYIIEKKWVKAIFLYLICCLFHAQAIVIVITPLLFFLRLDKKTIIIWVAVYVFAGIFAANMEDYLQLYDLSSDISDKAEYYKYAGDIGKEKYTFVTYLIGIFPYFLYPLFALYYLKKRDYKGTAMKLEPMLIVGLTFLVVEMQILRANRFTDYYRVYFAIFLAELFIYLIKERSKLYRDIKAYLVFAPLFLLLLFSAIRGEGWRYFPYTSIFDKTTTIQREQERGGAPAANPFEY